MISASDVLQIISEIHQFSMLLVEMKQPATFGILHSGNEKINYFKFEGRLEPHERRKLVQRISSGEIPESLHVLQVEQFLREIEGKRAKHIWLETGGTERKELVFLSISELKAFFRSHSRR